LDTRHRTMTTKASEHKTENYKDGPKPIDPIKTRQSLYLAGGIKYTTCPKTKHTCVPREWGNTL